MQRNQRQHLVRLPQAHHVAKHTSVALNGIEHRCGGHIERVRREEEVRVVVGVNEERMHGFIAAGNSLFFCLRDRFAFTRQHPPKGEELVRIRLRLHARRDGDYALQGVHLQTGIEEGNVRAERIIAVRYAL